LHRNFKISVELEKPDRLGMKEVAKVADVVFYSRIWVEAHGFHDPELFLNEQVPNTCDGYCILPSLIRATLNISSALMICPWGADGAIALQKNGDNTENVHSPAWKPNNDLTPVVE
jgi:ketohexokinase